MVPLFALKPRTKEQETMAKSERSTIGIWLNKETYKLFAKVCKRFGFQISEILEDFMRVFLERYPLEDPQEMHYIQAPAFVVKSQGSPNVEEEIKRGLLKWLNMFECPTCKAKKHYSKTYLEHLERHGLQPQCPTCQVPLEVLT